MIDVDAMDHADIDDIQIATGRDRASREIDAYDTNAELLGAQQSSLTITLLVEFTHTVELHRPEHSSRVMHSRSGSRGLDTAEPLFRCR